MRFQWIAGVTLAAACLGPVAQPCGARDFNEQRLQPWEEDPRYWQYGGEPVLLLGGSGQDNLFNHPGLPPDGLEAHLDLLVSVGGNYVRNTMSSRDEGNLWPHHRNEDGFYDLTRFDEEYWQRLRSFLALTAEREVFVQIEIFDRFDYAREPWDANPFNPRNNINYSAEEIGLPEEIRTHPGQRENPFFRTVPELEDNAELLSYQEAFAAKLLSITLEYDHVLYCISNETSESEHWSSHWAEFVRRHAREAGVGVEVTEMWDSWDLAHPMHRHTFDNPELYSFVDASQNNHQVGQRHWDNLQAARELIAEPPRPLNNVKIYGGVPHGGGLLEGTHKLWRNVLGGVAAARFHRPPAGPGLGEEAQAHLRAMRLLTTCFDTFAAEPANHLLSERTENEAYCAANPGRQYAVYFTDGGSVLLNPEGPGPFRVRWLEIENGGWTDEETVVGGQPLRLSPPGEGQWVVLVEHEGLN